VRAEQFKRVLRPDGSLIVNIKEPVIDGERSTYVLELIQSMRRSGWLWTEEFVWHKANCAPGQWPDRFPDAWERCLHFTLQRYFVMYRDAVIVPVDGLASLSDADMLRGTSMAVCIFATKISRSANRNSVYPTNVLHMAAEYRDVGNPAACPEGLAEWFIRLFTREGGLVLDPFVGSGSSAVAANRLGRDFIGIDLLARNIELAKARMAEVGSAAAA
jgi:site-specific DNA-methyltransferase (adenine-specific)